MDRGGGGGRPADLTPERLAADLASLTRDTNMWFGVVGRPTTVKGVVYIEAADVSVTTAPSATAQAAPPPPPPERPKFPPVIVFAMPLDGESEVPPDSRFG